MRCAAARHILAEEMDAPPVGPEREEEEAEQGRLAGARGPGEEGEGAALQPEAHLAQDLLPASVSEAYVVQFQHGVLLPAGCLTAR